jgi:hypothetical protein
MTFRLHSRGEVMAGVIPQRKQGSPQITPDEREHRGSGRDPEERPTSEGAPEEQLRMRREKAHDKTLADSFPTSDPPSSIPDPVEEDSPAA